MSEIKFSAVNTGDFEYEARITLSLGDWKRLLETLGPTGMQLPDYELRVRIREIIDEAERGFSREFKIEEPE